MRLEFVIVRKSLAKRGRGFNDKDRLYAGFGAAAGGVELDPRCCLFAQ